MGKSCGVKEALEMLIPDSTTFHPGYGADEVATRVMRNLLLHNHQVSLC